VQREDAIREHEEARAAILAQGCELSELPRAAHEEFVKAVQPLHEEARANYGKKALELL
jgi:TRAP-type C4-dicarboxylate transport system substrate-binding protein